MNVAVESSSSVTVLGREFQVAGVSSTDMQILMVGGIQLKKLYSCKCIQAYLSTVINTGQTPRNISRLIYLVCHIFTPLTDYTRRLACTAHQRLFFSVDALYKFTFYLLTKAPCHQAQAASDAIMLSDYITFHIHTQGLFAKKDAEVQNKSTKNSSKITLHSSDTVSKFNL